MARSLGYSLLLAVGLVLGVGLSQAQTVRLPKTGDPAFSVDVPTGWTYDYDTHGNLQFVASDHSTALQLSMITDASDAAETLDEVAAEIFKAADSPPYTRNETSTLLGHAGETFYGNLAVKTQLLPMKIVLARLDNSHIACLSTIVRPDATPPQLAALKALVGLVQLSGPQ